MRGVNTPVWNRREDAGGGASNGHGRQEIYPGKVGRENVWSRESLFTRNIFQGFQSQEEQHRRQGGI